ncbi:MAG: hypothetical protein JXD19_05255 [Deltaproteobacteria bacterium]|nr:hypothetical protein [Deltaproteobacteria bacterium]
MIKINLDLRKHCVETAAKKSYQSVLALALKDDSAVETLGTELEMLKTALETFDFETLRGRHPQLSGGYDDEVVLFLGDDGRIGIRINGRTVDVPLK